MQKLSRSVVSIELSRSYLKMIEMAPGNQEVVSIAIEPLEPSQYENDAYLTDRIRSVLTANVKSSLFDLIGSVPGEHAVIRVVEVPIGEEKTEDAIHWDIETYLDGPLDEWLLDYQPLGPDGSEKARLHLVAAFRRAGVERMQRILQESGFPLVVLDVDVFAAANAFEVNYPELQKGRSLLVKADAHRFQLIHLEEGRFEGLDSFPVEPGIAALSGQAKVERLRKAVAEIRKVLNRVRGERGEIRTLMICGDFSTDTDFRETLQSGVSQPVQSLNPFKAIPFTPSAGEEDAVLAIAPQCAAALGLALRHSGDC